ncbi:hypothetical protein DIPPA_04042 [Diplonema papillatum]|nr:hypothetical protein DIPPA_04042 [Diplonema papillatum]
MRRYVARCFTHRHAVRHVSLGGLPGDSGKHGDQDADEEDVFVFSDQSATIPPRPEVSHWMQRYQVARDATRRVAAQEKQLRYGAAVAVAAKEREREEDEKLLDTVIHPKDKESMLREANEVSTLKRPRWGTTEKGTHSDAMRLRIAVEERELARQVKAHDTIQAQRKDWGLHPVHFVKRWNTRLDVYGNDRVPYSQEKLEKEKAAWLLEDHLLRKRMELAYAEMGWQPHQFWKLMEDWYKELPAPDRFFMSPYYRSMRPRSSNKRATKKLQQMQEEEGLVVFEERNTHRMIREAMLKQQLPFINLPPPRIIWERLPDDCIIDDYICGREDVTLERRDGAILLRRWLPNGQKISCEVIGGDYLNEIIHVTPVHVDWAQIERAGGFLLHNNMVNAVDHPNNVKIVATVEEAVACLLAFDVDASVEFDPKSYMFYPYLWVTDPEHYTKAEFDEEATESALLASVSTPGREERRHKARLRRSRATRDESAPLDTRTLEQEAGMYAPTFGDSPSVGSFKGSPKGWRNDSQ